MLTHVSYIYMYIYIIAWLYVSFSCLVYLAACIFAIYSSIYLLVHSSADCSSVPLQAYIHTCTQVLYISSHPPFPEILDGWQFLENSTRARNAPRPNRDLSLNLVSTQSSTLSTTSIVGTSPNSSLVSPLIFVFAFW